MPEVTGTDSARVCLGFYQGMRRIVTLGLTRFPRRVPGNCHLTEAADLFNTEFRQLSVERQSEPPILIERLDHRTL
jgi:hypothetical protein